MTFLCHILLFSVLLVSTSAFICRQPVLSRNLVNIGTGSFSRQQYLEGSRLCVQCTAGNSYDAQPYSAFVTKLKAMDIPNKLTISRILAVPLFLLSFQLNWYPATVGIFAAASLTDYLDGFLARRWSQSTTFGTFLDPVADKLMVASAMVLLTSRFPSPLYVISVALLVCREIGVSALREFMSGKGERGVVKVGTAGKLKTLFQMVAAVLLLMVVPGPPGWNDLCQSVGMEKHVVFTMGMLAMYVSTFLSLYSGWQYLRAAWPTLNGKE